MSFRSMREIHKRKQPRWYCGTLHSENEIWIFLTKWNSLRRFHIQIESTFKQWVCSRYGEFRWIPLKRGKNCRSEKKNGLIRCWMPIHGGRHLLFFVIKTVCLHKHTSSEMNEKNWNVIGGRCGYRHSFHYTYVYICVPLTFADFASHNRYVLPQAHMMDAWKRANKILATLAHYSGTQVHARLGECVSCERMNWNSRNSSCCLELNKKWEKAKWLPVLALNSFIHQNVVCDVTRLA